MLSLIKAASVQLLASFLFKARNMVNRMMLVKIVRVSVVVDPNYLVLRI